MRNLEILRFVGMTASLLLLLSGCSRDGEREESDPKGRIPVTATFSIPADLCAEIGGDRISVHVLVPAEGEVHSYEPSPRSSRALGRSRLVVMNGLHLEDWMERLLDASSYRGAVCVLSKGIRPRREEGGAEDPHMWQNPRNMILAASNLATALETLDPEGTAIYRKRREDWTARMEALDAWLARAYGSVPASKRKVITTHDALGYLGEAYGIRFVSPMGLNPGTEASAGALGLVLDQMKNQGIRTLFLESGGDRRLVEALARDGSGEVGGTLYADRLSPPDGPAGTYEKMMRVNAEALIEGMAKNR